MCFCLMVFLLLVCHSQHLDGLQIITCMASFGCVVVVVVKFRSGIVHIITGIVLCYPGTVRSGDCVIS